VPNPVEAKKDLARRRRMMEIEHRQEDAEDKARQEQDLLKVPKPQGMAQVEGGIQKFAQETQMIIAMQDNRLNAIAQAFGPAAANMAQMRARMQANAVQSFPYIGEGV
jgi:predicted XRE-type DNA-binding protein